jgi:uncharacterized protein YmfQ (DUF2313 family)
MGMTVADYLQVLLQLLPPGKAFPRDLQGEMPATLMAIADELARVDARSDVLLDEADPRTALETIIDWEGVLGFPEPEGLSATLENRRRAVVGKLIATGGQSRAYFIAVAAALGFDITISEFQPFTCVTPIDQPIYPETIRFIWQVDVLEADNAGEVLEESLELLKPAHTAILFNYAD